MLGNQQATKYPAFSRISESDVAILLSKMEQRSLEANQLVCHQNQPDSSIRILVEGELTIFSESPNGERLNLRNVAVGDVFGLEQFQKRNTRLTSIEASTNSKILEMDLDTFRGSYEQLPAAMSLLLDNLARIESGRIGEIRGLFPTRSGSTPLPRSASRAVPPSRQRRGNKLKRDSVQADAYPDTVKMISVSILEKLRQVGTCVSYPIGTSFYDKGDTPEYCTVVLSGKLRVSSEEEDDTVQVDTETAGSILGLTALYPHQMGEVTAYTVSEVHALEFTRQAYDKLLLEPSPDICRLQEMLLRRVLDRKQDVLQKVILSESRRPKTSNTVPMFLKELDAVKTESKRTSRPTTAETCEMIPINPVSESPIEDDESSAQTLSMPAVVPPKPKQ